LLLRYLKSYICNSVAELRDISKYEDVSEEDDPSYVSYGYLNGLFPNTSADADTVAVDTTAVDTAAAYY